MEIGAAANAKSYPSKAAVVFEGERYTWAEWNARINQLAHALRALGLGRGDKLAVMLHNCHQFLEVTPLVRTMQYYKDPEKTKEAFRDEYMTVGDMGYLDEDGYLYIVDRKTDMVISGGVNIYPAEIEEVIRARADADDVIDFCRERLADYKRPRSVDFVAEVPRNPSGKLLKREIRAPYWEGRERRV